MSLAKDFLSQNGLLEDERADSTIVYVTPRWPTSSHVLALVIDPQGLASHVVKIPRLSELDSGVTREAKNLRALQDARPGGYDTIPRLLAFESFRGFPVLVESALVGAAVNETRIRQHAPKHWIDRGLEWLWELPSFEAPGDGWTRLLEAPLRRFGAVFPASSEERSLTERTLELLDVLREARFPLLYEHGDLSHPNILELPDGRLAVVDWELALQDGLPGHDLTFFIQYVIGATARARTVEHRLRLFDGGFVATQGEGRSAFRRYLERLGIGSSLYAPLVLACWARYTANLLGRVTGSDGVSAPLVSNEQASARLRAYPYYELWRHTVQRFEALDSA